MREPPSGAATFGLLAEFDRPERLVEATRRTREAGYRRIDAFTPFPIDGLAGELGFRERWVPRLTFAGGVCGAALAYLMQVGTNLDFPIDIGGRPLIAPQAFLLITFELMVLGAVLFSIGGMLVLNRLPRLHHPLFDVPDFHLASSSRFFLVVLCNDERFDDERTHAFLEGLDPVRIARVGRAEQPA